MTFQFFPSTGQLTVKCVEKNPNMANPCYPSPISLYLIRVSLAKLTEPFTAKRVKMHVFNTVFHYKADV